MQLVLKICDADGGTAQRCSREIPGERILVFTSAVCQSPEKCECLGAGSSSPWLVTRNLFWWLTASRKRHLLRILWTLAVIVLCGYIGLWTFWFQELRQLIWTKLWQRKIWVQLSFNGQMNVIELLLWVTVLISQPMVSGHYWPFLCSGHVRIGSGCVHVTAKWDLVKQLLASDGSCHSHWPIHPSGYALTYIQR